MDTYLEIIDTRSGNACLTGIGAMFTSLSAMTKSFENARQLHVNDAPFLLDFYREYDLIDTINLTADGVEKISGTKPKSTEFYIEYDRKYQSYASQTIRKRIADLPRLKAKS